MSVDLDSFGRSDLHYAANERTAEDVEKLLAAGHDPNLADKQGWTPLHFAAQTDNVEICRLLLNAGASVDSIDSYGNTPLWRAVFNSTGSGDLIQLLRNSGSDPYRQNHSGVSPVGLARNIANFDIARFFSDCD